MKEDEVITTGGKVKRQPIPGMALDWGLYLSFKGPAKKRNAVEETFCR